MRVASTRSITEVCKSQVISELLTQRLSADSSSSSATLRSQSLYPTEIMTVAYFYGASHPRCDKILASPLFIIMADVEVDVELHPSGRNRALSSPALG